MSNEALAWAYKLPIKGPAKPVLVALADFADEAGSCYPGQEKLALMTGLSLRSVSRALVRLEDVGLLLREHRYDRRGYRTSDRYFLSLDVQVLPVTVPTGHSAYQSDSPRLHATQSTPTGHSDRVTISRTLRENPQGEGRGFAPAPESLDDSTATQKLGHGEPVAPWCKRHASTEGTDRPCRACKLAAEQYEATLIAGSRSQLWQPARKPVRHIPGLCDAHRQPEATCEMCIREARETVQAQFGGNA